MRNFLTLFQTYFINKPIFFILAIPLILTACNSAISNDNSNALDKTISWDQDDKSKKITVAVFGAIHSGHKRSKVYSLNVLEQAIRNFRPDTVFIEIPPTSLTAAQSSFDQFGEVRERRTRAFPELTDVVFPLQKKLGYDLVATAAWSRQLASQRSAILKQIENDPARRSQWQEHISARNTLFAMQRKNGNNPLYIHTDQYDTEVKTAQTPYEKYFDRDIGAGGWGPINAAHIALMDDALDKINIRAKASSGKTHRVLVIFGAWHKYKILEAMKKRDDVALVDAKQFFNK